MLERCPACMRREATWPAGFRDLGRVEEYDSEAMRSGIRWTEIMNKEVPE